MAVISDLDARPAGRLRTGFDAPEAALLGAATLLMLWPALYNGFPLIFSDTGTYISQMMEHHLGWDRPPYYSMLLLALDWGHNLWLPTIAQCAVTAWMIRRTQRMVAPRAGLGAGALLLAPLVLLTALPWTAAQIMPDIFTPLMVLAFAILVLDDRMRRRERRSLALLITLAIMVHLSNLPIYAGLCLCVLVLRLRARPRPDWKHLLPPLAIGVTALIAVNLIASGTPSPSPYGDTFVLARLLSDGPARATLARDCPTQRWALCRYQADLAHSADRFLWTANSPLYRAGGPIHLIDQTNAIVRDTVMTYPAVVARNAVRDTLRQMVTFAPGSGLRPWSATAGATIRRDLPPATVRVFLRSRQARRRLAIGEPLAAIVATVTIAGIVATLAFVLWAVVQAIRPFRVIAALRHTRPLNKDRPIDHRPIDHRLFWLAGFVLLALVGNAVVTGSLSGPHDRYESRIVWLAVLTGELVLARCYAAWRSRPTSTTA
ncbi:hypothetical protein AruPA_11105 [Acidiphilium sp. PA]|uniref:hypothetical protein n=1 Tax=Acidiphilium sp. PA TaxID=2871705 RepID=UPI002243DB15|nr:hypothetical protein [Acidiphilium sp. PA]MCW8307587.1 hypothetical protein [Acidiphilium sp. PA]